MKDFLTYTAIGLALWVACLSISKSHSKPSHEIPPEDIKEFSMKTETGEVVLTREPCTFIKMGLKGYPYAAYATEKGHANHEGCWTMDVIDRYKAVKVYYPEIDATAVYNPALFGPRGIDLDKKVEPNVNLEPTFENNNMMLYGTYRF